MPARPPSGCIWALERRRCRQAECSRLPRAAPMWLRSSASAMAPDILDGSLAVDHDQHAAQCGESGPGPFFHLFHAFGRLGKITSNRVSSIVAAAPAFLLMGPSVAFDVTAPLPLGSFFPERVSMATHDEVKDEFPCRSWSLQWPSRSRVRNAREDNEQDHANGNAPAIRLVATVYGANFADWLAACRPSTPLRNSRGEKTMR